MRTTITIDNDLLAELKRKAVQTGTSVSRLIEQAVRVMVSQPEAPGSCQEFSLVTWGKGGHFTPYNVDKTSGLLEIDDVFEFGR